jgi:antitoxin component YwqK of YwqJK toxin-antitoxin module
MVKQTFATVVFLALGLFLSTPSLAANSVTREYWDAGKTKPKNVQVTDEKHRQTGEWILWFEDGGMKSKTSFLQGEVLLFESWYPDGQKQIQQPMAEGLPHGLWIWWKPDGTVAAKSYFTMGTGVEYYFTPDGAERLRVFWISGVRLREETPAQRDNEKGK